LVVLTWLPVPRICKLFSNQDFLLVYPCNRLWVWECLLVSRCSKLPVVEIKLHKASPGETMLLDSAQPHPWGTVQKSSANGLVLVEPPQVEVLLQEGCLLVLVDRVLVVQAGVDQAVDSLVVLAATGQQVRTPSVVALVEALEGDSLVVPVVVLLPWVAGLVEAAWAEAVVVPAAAQVARVVQAPVDPLVWDGTT